VLVAVRYTISGVLMLVASRWKRQHIPGVRDPEFWRTALCGFGTLAIGNTCLTVAEQWIPAGLAALFVTTSPFWMVGIDALIPGGERFHKPLLWGMLIGLVGVLLLLLPTSEVAEAGAPTTASLITAFLVLQLGNVGWSVGAIFQKRMPSKAHPIVSGAVQQLTTGMLFWIPALWTIRQTEIDVTWRAGLAILYLATFGSIIGYSAFLYAMDKLPIALVSTYTYVNPIVACVLGWLILGERFGMREVIAMAITFVGVAVVRHFQKQQNIKKPV
jgi:drug/metabolite transporter (DMT)-like permease